MMENNPLNLRLWLLGVGSPRLTESECAVGLFVSLRDRGFCALVSCHFVKFLRDQTEALWS